MQEDVPVVDQVPVPSVPFITPVPSPAVMSSKPARQIPDANRFLTTARRLAMENYNRTRDRDKFPELTISAFYIVWYSKTMNHWRATVESVKASRISWSITYNGADDECYIVVWKKLTKITVPMGEE